jgi:hypothetical protein
MLALIVSEVGVFGALAWPPARGEPPQSDFAQPPKKQEDALMRSMKERALRERAHKLGYAIHKSRSRSIHEDNLGKYALVKKDSNSVVLGERFDASLEEIAEYLD